MYKNKVKIKGVLVLMVLAIFAISSLALIDSATAVAANSNQDSNNVKSYSVNEESLEGKLSSSTLQNKESLEGKLSSSTLQNKTSKNGKEVIKKNILTTKDKNSLADDKKDMKSSIEKTKNQDEKMTASTVNSVKAAENGTNTSSQEENPVASSNQKNKAVNDNYGIEIQAIGLILVSIFCIISFSSFILYLKS